MDVLNSLTAELYFWGHFDVLQNAAEQFAENGSVDYKIILSEKVEHHLRAVLKKLPLHQSLNEAIEEWFYEEKFLKGRSREWDAWKFHRENGRQAKEYRLPVMHLCKLAVDAFDVTSDGLLCTPDEENAVYFTRFGCIPPILLGATRFAMKKNMRWDGNNLSATSVNANQEFQAFLHRGLADAHVHLSGAARFTDLLYPAIRGIAPPAPSSHGFLENGNTHSVHDFPFHHLALRPLLLACKTMFVAILHHAERHSKSFKEFLADVSLSRRFWKLMYLAAKEPRSHFVNRFEMSVGAVLNKVGNYKRFFGNEATFEKHWFTIVRHILETPDDMELNYHFAQLTRCICSLYRPMFHREGFYEFDHLFRFIDGLTGAAGHPDGRPPRRSPKDDPMKRIGYDSMQKRCRHLRNMQLRTTIPAEKKRPQRCRPHSYHESHRSGRKMPLTVRRLEIELQRHLKTYEKYIEELSRCCVCGCEIPSGHQKENCSNCQKPLPKTEPIRMTFPIHFVRREMGSPSGKRGRTKPRKNFHFKQLWHRVELLASLFQKKPLFRYFFGRIDVANNEDLKPNWVFALMFNELEDRLKKSVSLDAGIRLPRMRYDCHAGEHFTSSIQGLRRIWEAIEHFPRLDGIGHAFALGVENRFPSEMPADELLDDLVWLLIHREYIQGIPLEKIERKAEEIADATYGREFGRHDEIIDEIIFRDLKYAYRWRFDREKIAEYIGILTYEKEREEYHYTTDFKLPKPDMRQILPKAARIMRKHFTIEKVGIPYTLSSDLRETLEKCYPFLRDYVKREIINKNAVVEVCPASNFRIGNLTKVEDHPLFSMCPPDTNGGISVVFGSDNPAMFQTSIDDEYLFVKEAMNKKYPELSQDRQLEYLEMIRRRSMELCCDDLPTDPLAILSLIKRLV